MKYEDNIYGTPLAIFYAGTFAVAIFFVLSGFVLSIGYFKSGDENIIKKLAQRRYLRLVIPAAAATLACFLLMSVGASKLIENASTTTASDWLSGTWDFDSSVFHAIYSGFIGIFISGHSAYDNVLWTMRIELLGSFLVFGFLLFLAKSKNRWFGYVLLSILTFNTWYLAFIVGVLLADCYAHGLIHRVKEKARTTVIGLLFAAAIVLGSYPHGSHASDTVYRFLNVHLPGIKMNYEMFYLTVGAALIIVTVLLSTTLQRWLKNPRISILGKYTYSLYLTHLAVIYTVSTTIFIYLHSVMGYTRAVLVAGLLSAPVIWLVSYLFTKYVDQPSIRFASKFAYIYENHDLAGVAKQRATYYAALAGGATKRLQLYIRPLRPTPQPDEAEYQ
jgi:peptidoglycan/LPS O-acetylase OafA/YrhL